MKQEIIAHAAEAVIIREGDKVIKRRLKKGYRIPELDEKLRKLRTRNEAKLLEKALLLVSCPKVIKSDEKTKEIDMEFINGKKLSENLDELKNKCLIIEKAGEETAKLHDNNIIHGDLTTSNMILVENSEDNKVKNIKLNKSINQLINNSKLIKINNKTQNNNVININKDNSESFKVYIIDFGLGFISPKIEDKAVDLHLIKQALEAKHFQNWKELFSNFLKGYKKSKEACKVLAQLEKVEARGRYRKKAE